jgi:hypothetical protein
VHPFVDVWAKGVAVAAFKQHITFSSLLGAGYGAALIHLGVEWPHAVLAGGLCAISGMLPDLDSDSGRPVRELFGAVAVAAPLLFLRRFQRAGLNGEELVLIACGLYLAIRFGLAWFFKHLTVHRGMFHSLPAAFIAAEAVFLADTGPEAKARLTLAGGVLIGFLSHLVLDELYAVDARGLRLNKAAGSALKLTSQSVTATLFTWLVFVGLTYLAGVDSGYLRPIHFSADSLPGKYRERSTPARIPSPLGLEPGSSK